MDGSTDGRDSAQDKLVQDFKAVIADTEELLEATAGVTGEQIAAARAKLEDRVATIQKRFAEVEAGLSEHAKAAYEATDKLVREHPWPAVGVAAAVGFLIGLLSSRRG
jgi:ElaB/YqjD/DUF883 family membrane-anchored ribosome-binding protein